VHENKNFIANLFLYVCVIFSRKSSIIALGGGNMTEASAMLMDELKS